MLHTTSNIEYSIRTVGKDYESLVCYTGNFGLFLSEGKVLFQNYPGSFNENTR